MARKPDMSDRCGAPTASGRPCRRTAGRCPSHPAATGGNEAGDGDGAAGPGPVRQQVDRALAGVAEDWRTELARALADSLDAQPQASMARELRALMSVIDERRPQGGRATEEGSTVDDLAARRAERRAAAGGAE